MEKKTQAKSSTSGKSRALEDTIKQVKKKLGRGAIFRLGESSVRLAAEVIPSGSLSLDLALGTGGIPRGRMTEICGTESSGKTTLAYHIVGEAQKKRGDCTLC